MSNPLQEARDYLEMWDSPARRVMDSEEVASHIMELLPALIDCAEQWQAQAIEAKAEGMLCISEEGHKAWKEGSEEDYDFTDEFFGDTRHILGKKSWRAQAVRELEAEAGTWRKIEPDEVAAIQLAIDIIDQSSDSLEEEMALKVLRRLLEGLI